MKLPPSISHQPFTRSQAEAAGLTRKQLVILVEDRFVVRVLHGVYQPSSLSDTVENRCRAAALVLRPAAVVCDRTAAWLHGVDTFAYRELEILPPLETFALRDMGRTRRGGCSGGERDLAPCDIYVIGGLQVTTPLRTALDLGCRLYRADALAAIDGYMRICGITQEDLQGQLPRYRGRRGVIQLRRLVPLASPLSESPGESIMRLAIIDADLPMPQLQYWVEDNGVPRYRLDLAYPKCKVAVEYDGHAYHDSPAQRAADEARRAWLRAHGWTVIVVTSTSFTADAKREWTSELALALGIW